MKKNIILISIIFLAFIFILYGREKEQKAYQSEKHEVTVRLILVDVIVTDKDGNFVTDLARDDFELYEDNVKVSINSMDLISLEREEIVAQEKKEVETPPLAQREKRLTVVFDSINTARRELERSKAQIIHKLVELFKVGREIMICELTRKEGMKVLQPFTMDEALLARAVRKATGSIWVEKSTEDLETGLVLEDKAAAGQEKVERGYSEKVKDFTEGTHAYFSGARFEKTINGLLALINTIKDYKGRKTILLISGGIPYGYSFRDNVKIFDPFNLLNKPGLRRKDEILDGLIHFANAQNITFYALDPETYIKYLAAHPDFAGGNILFDSHDSDRAKEKLDEFHNLNLLAQDTGGTSLKGAKRFENFYQIVKNDLTYYYELSYYPRREEADGKYHKIEVRVNRPKVNVRFRKGYSDYSENQKEKLLLASASYNPSLFKQIPFEAQAIPFAVSEDRFILWMTLALPIKKIILEGTEGISFKSLKLNIWVKDPAYLNAFTGQVDIPINMTPSFLEFIRNVEYLGYNYITPEIKLKKDIYQTVFALYDEKTDEIGTVEHTIINPDLKNAAQPAIVAYLLGTLEKDTQQRPRTFTLSKKEGTLQVYQHKFYPSVLNYFRQGQMIGVFLQLYLPQDELEIEPLFFVIQEDKEMTQLEGEMVDRSWDKKQKIWNGVYLLDLSNTPSGDYRLSLEIPTSREVQVPGSGFKLKKEIIFKIS